MGPRIRSGFRLIAMFALVGVLVSAAAGSGPARAQTARSASTFNLTDGWTPQGVLNPFSPSSINFTGLVNNPLAYFVRDTLSYVPQLAVSWQATPKQIVVNLRHGVLWNDGTPFTSKDVVTTFLAGGTFDYPVWNALSSVRARGDYQVVFNLLPNVSLSNTLFLLLTQFIYPDHIWGQYLPANTASMIASHDAAGLNKVSQKLLTAKPASFVGTGPFQISNIGSAQIILTKSPKFWLANKIKVPSVTVNQTLTNQAAWSQLLSGLTDFGWPGSPVTVQQQWLSKPDNHVIHPWDYSMYSMYFNTQRYPMTLTAFRQAVAYAINRPTVTTIGSGPGINVPYAVPTGLLPPVAQKWLTPAQLKSLNPYNYDPTKAASMLTAAGFKKVNGSWQAPNGQPVKLTLTAPAGWSDTITMMEAVASELKQFGLDVTATTGEQPGYWADQKKGTYDISWGWGGWWTIDPIQEYYDILVNENFDPANPQNKGMGFGPEVALPGFGKVNLTQFLQKMTAVNDTAMIKKATFALAQTENQQLPFLNVEVKRLQTFYSSRSFTNWPPTNSPLWDNTGGDATSSLSLMMQKGYIVPK